jgi:hypothetical protein
MNMSSSNVGGSPPFMVKRNKFPFVMPIVSPRDKKECKGKDSESITPRGDGISNTGMGECLQELPGSGLQAVTTRRREDLQSEGHSLPVENEVGNQVDTIHTYSPHKRKGPSENLKEENSLNKSLKNKERIQVLGYVPLQIANLTLEEVEFGKQIFG